ncbi:glycine zipper 2TM domain-containing protein [Novosphingobium naphthalenivorans]|uniref:glycine zipper 2TM domain-containing protein n=1 Tax=Novosphingobium naphthalenivorans TaxID=273168 RepID=UPI00082B2E4B|nr:glycine zipper 2TM domain-containing protein [Novosphingobium naphthalenivorans]
MKKLLLALTIAAATLPGTPAAADPPPHAPAYGERAKERYHDAPRHSDRRIYDSRGRYVTPRRITRNSYVWRGRDGRYYCRRDNGTTGLIIGAGLGALAGHELAGRGDKTLGALLGGVVGGVLGREIDRGDLRCR